MVKFTSYRAKKVLMRKSRELGDRMFFNKDLVELSELFCLCCMAALKSLPALSFNALIIPILRIVCTYYINTLKREIVDTNAYKLQPSLSERVIVDGHGCHTALHLVSKLKNIKTKFLRCTGYLNSIKNPLRQDLLLILVLVRQQNFLNC